MKKFFTIFFTAVCFSLFLSSCSKGTEVERKEYENYYGYQYLSEQENAEGLLKAYEKFAEGIEEYKYVIYLFDIKEPLTPDEFRIVYNCVWSDFPQFFWLPGDYDMKTFDGYLFSLFPVYEMEKEEVEEMRRGFDGKVEEILNEISEMTKEEKELYVHDYLVNAVSFAYVEESCMADTAYGALIDGRANCSGYSFAFMYLMRETGIPCIMCYGYANQGDHAWNIVQLEDEYRHVDVTWADWEEKGISHEYYNVTTEKISEDHEIIEVIYNYPNC